MRFGLTACPIADLRIHRKRRARQKRGMRHLGIDPIGEDVWRGIPCCQRLKNVDQTRTIRFNPVRGLIMDQPVMFHLR